MQTAVQTEDDATHPRPLHHDEARDGRAPTSTSSSRVRFAQGAVRRGEGALVAPSAAGGLIARGSALGLHVHQRRLPSAAAPVGSLSSCARRVPPLLRSRCVTRFVSRDVASGADELGTSAPPVATLSPPLITAPHDHLSAGPRCDVEPP
jgi:hypothetical protein